MMKRILLVDDEIFFADGLKLFLQKSGFEVVTANDGKQGFLHFREEKFDLVITDIRMPGDNGLQLISDIRKRNSTVKIIAMSGGGYVPADDYLRISRLFGADAILQKPFSVDSLLNEINKLISPAV